jgi:acyl-CoA dehydrogenase
MSAPISRIADHIEGKEIVVDISMAKYWTTDMASRVAGRCLQLFGGYGYCVEYPIARARTARVADLLWSNSSRWSMMAPP